MMKKTSSIKILKELRRKVVQIMVKDLPHGYKVEIAKRSGLSYRTVLRFFKGQDNEKLYEVLGEYYSGYKSDTEKIINKLGFKLPINKDYEEINEFLDSI